jgi:hypothetical protein
LKGTAGIQPKIEPLSRKPNCDTGIGGSRVKVVHAAEGEDRMDRQHRRYAATSPIAT